jgi:hypothetical protein
MKGHVLAEAQLIGTYAKQHLIAAANRCFLVIRPYPLESAERVNALTDRVRARAHDAS